MTYWSYQPPRTPSGRNPYGLLRNAHTLDSRVTLNRRFSSGISVTVTLQ